MRVLKHLSIFTALMLFVQLASAQRLLVQYDFLKDDYKYYKVAKNGSKKLISRPVVTRNHNVKIEVINYNPFVYSATASFESTEIQEEANLNFFSLISPLGLPTGGSSFLSQITGADNMTRGSRGTSGVMSIPQARDAFQAIEETYITLYKAEQMMNNIDFILDKTHKLKYNRYLPADSIKGFTQELLNELFLQDNVETKDFLDMANTLNSTIKGDLALFRSNVNSFTNVYNEYASTSPEPNFEGKGLDKLVKSWEQQASTFVREFDGDLLIDKLDVLETIYQSIMNTPYIFNVSDVAEGDAIVVKLDFYKNPDEDSDATSVDDLLKVKSKEIDITVRGDLKISSSIGLAFPYYADNMEFINKDSLITSIDGNNFTPNISAYLNFYPYSARNVQFGGTFGVGIPISDDSKNFNFLLGVSTIFGSDNRMVLSFGTTLGQVNKVDQGFAEGDNLGDLITEVPMRKAYQVGGFVGISFALTQ